MKLTLRCTRTGESITATWNQNPVDVSKIATALAGVRRNATIEAECSYAEDRRIVATAFLRRVDPESDQPGFDDYAQAQKLIERGQHAEARKVLDEAPVLPPEGLLLRAQLARDAATCALVLEEMVTHPRATDAQLAEVAASAIATKVEREVIVELLGERLAQPSLGEVARRLLAEQPIASTPTWWVAARFQGMLAELEKPCGYACEAVDPDDDAAWDRVLAEERGLLGEAQRRGIAGATESVGERLSNWLAKERKREKARLARATRERSKAFETLARHHGREVPRVLRDAWLANDRQISFLSLEQYFGDADYGARARLDSFDLSDPRYLVFGADAGSEGPPFFALDLEDGFRVVALDPELDEPQHVAASLQIWERWRLLRS